MRHLRLTLALLVAALAVRVPTAAREEPAQVKDFSLKDAAGKGWTLRQQKGKVIVVAFLATECPMSNGYLPGTSLDFGAGSE